ncbi:movement protein [Sesamum angolense]|uniref:Movement protein n=1 Tax=Sesamum angolense TaxID=2727404 RepID=A0AAE1W078_9LAMI|nr:movement protein [Sesamum angolense]
MTVSNKTMERIMRQDSNLSPYDGFRIGGIGKVLNQIGLNQRKHHIIYKVSSGEFAIPMEFTGNVMEMQLIPKEEILEELSRLREEIAVTMKWIHIGTIEVVIKATFKEGIDSEIHLSIMDRRINNLRDGCLGTMIGNLYAGKLMFDIHPRIAYNLADQDFSRVPLHQDLKKKDLMKEGNRPYSITYRIAYALSNTHHSDLFLRKEYIEIPRIFKEFTKPVVGRYEGMLEIAGHEILVTGVAGRENGSMTLGISFLEDHKTMGKKRERKGFFTKNPDTQYGNSRSQNHDRRSIWNALFRDNQRNLLIFTTNCGSEIQVLPREKAFNRIMPINFRSKRGDVDAKLTHPKMQDKRKFGIKDNGHKRGKPTFSQKCQETNPEKFQRKPLAWWDRNKIEDTLKIKEECKYEYVRYKPIQMNMEDKKDMQMIIKEHINLGLIEPGISAYSNPGFLEHIVEKIRNFPDILKDKKQLQSFLGVVNFAGIFIKDLAKYRKDFRPLLKETESTKWKWEEIHTQRVRELKQVCNNLPKLAIPQDEDELVVYTDANDYRWAAFLMKNTTTEEEPCRYTGGLFTEQQARVWHINEKEFFTIAIRTTMVASTSLWNDLQEPIRKASSSEMTNELRKHDTKHALRVQDSRPVAADSSTACTRLSSDSGVMATNESQGVQTSDDSSQPSSSGVKEEEISLRPMTDTSKANTNELSSSSSSAWQVYQRMWEKLISRRGVNPSKTIIETSGKYNRVWMMEGSKPEEVREWYEFGALASVHTTSPSFPKISKLPDWISEAVYDSWQNNPHLKRGDILELKFISAAPETAGKGSHPAFHFIKLQRPDMVAFNRIKAASEEAPLVSAISEDDISTRRAWGLWVCLTEMDKVKYPFKIFSNKVNGSFLLNSMTGKSTEFAENMFEKKRMLIWENKLPATEVTRMKTCNMLHVGQWHNHVCPCCEKQEKPLFGTKIRVTHKKPEPKPDKGKRKNFYKEK